MNTSRRHQAIPLQQAAQESATLASLTARIQASQACLKAVQPLLPAALRPSVQAGPLEDGQWCLIVRSSAVAAKLRQLLPDLQQRLIHSGLPVTAIRVKVSWG